MRRNSGFAKPFERHAALRKFRLQRGGYGSVNCLPQIQRPPGRQQRHVAKIGGRSGKKCHDALVSGWTAGPP